VARFFTRQVEMAEMDIAAAQNVLSALFGDRPDDWQKIAAIR
jgi:exodeoxyribonuclease V alpha subunit